MSRARIQQKQFLMLLTVSLILGLTAAFAQPTDEPAQTQQDTSLTGEGSYTGTRSGQNLVDVDFMFIGAHPDDEGGITATAARYVLDEGFKGTVITLTQGEGGGNATGPEGGPSLGIIRSDELDRSLDVVGIDTHYFTGQEDFYYTLFAEEAQERWGDEYVCDVARIVRVTRPEVIITMWPGPGTHGHHQMAARAATTVFNNADDPSFCPEQITAEFIDVWQPLKLYYYGFRDTFSVAVPTDTWSRTAYMPYADVKALALANFRSQGFDQRYTVPVEDPQPERFLLVKSLVPTADPETHLLAGAVINAGSSPAGVMLEVAPQDYRVGVNGTLPVTVTLTNRTDAPMDNVELSLEAPEELTVSQQDEVASATLAPGESASATFEVAVPDNGELIGQQRLTARYTAMQNNQEISGQNMANVEVGAPIQVGFKPLFDIANYREFAQETGTEWVIPLLPTRLPLTVGETNPVTVEITNLSDTAATGQLGFDLPEGINVEGDLAFEVPANTTTEKTINLVVTDAALPSDRQSASLTGTVSATVGDYTSTNQADIYALPTLDIARVEVPPTIDGDLSDMQSLTAHEFSHTDLGSGEAEGPEDTGGQFYAAYDDENLYLGVRVTDQTVVCNIDPNDIRGHWRSDSVEVTIDPTAESANTSTTFKTGIFPCTTEGFGARGERDADANQGVIEETAPGMAVASQQTENGYVIEMAIPWTAMPGQPQQGDTIGLNVLVYDGDQADAQPGANVGESRAGWASVIGAQQATPYVWPMVTLGE